ncbi:MAG: alpha/beta hydrolase [Pseudomonadota bacterium]
MTGIVLIPGHLCDARLYAPQRPLLESRAPVALADTRSDDRVSAMAERMLSEHEGPLALVGLSMGGMIAMEALRLAPERILGAALLDTNPYAPREPELRWRVKAVADARAQGLGAYLDVFMANFWAHAPERTADLATEVAGMMGAIPFDVFERQAAALSARQTMTEAVAAYLGPLAVIWGAEDRLTPPKVHQEIAAVPTAVATEIPDCGHLATLEAPEAVNAALVDWLDRTGL